MGILKDRERERRQIEEEWAPFEKGTRWKCIRCSSCCRIPWKINLTWKEYDRLKRDPRARGLTDVYLEVDPVTGADHPYFAIEGKCPMLIEKGAVCSIYPDWPYTCATYPFLLMPDGDLMVHRDCRGFGHGPVIIEGEIKSMIIRERKKAGMLTSP